MLQGESLQAPARSSSGVFPCSAATSSKPTCHNSSHASSSPCSVLTVQLLQHGVALPELRPVAHLDGDARVRFIHL